MPPTAAAEAAAVIFDHLKNGDTHAAEVVELQAIFQAMRADSVALRERVDAQDAFGDLLTALDTTLSELGADVSGNTAVAAQVQPLLVELRALKVKEQERHDEELRVRTLEAEALKESAAHNISLLDIMRRKDVWLAIGGGLSAAGIGGGIFTTLLGGS
jgi:hypothetical protein